MAGDDGADDLDPDLADAPGLSEMPRLGGAARPAAQQMEIERLREALTGSSNVRALPRLPNDSACES
jgi:hypothetical protein